MSGARPKYPIALSETQGAELTHRSLSYRAPYAEVRRARVVLLAHHQPTWANTQIARTGGCARDTGKAWRRRWQQQGTVAPTPRPGAPRHCPALGRAQLVALACRQPSAHGKVWKRWSGENRAQVAVEQGLVVTTSPSTIGGWLRQDQLKPWRYPSWPHSPDPQFVEKALLLLSVLAPPPLLCTRSRCGRLRTKAISSFTDRTATRVSAMSHILP